MSNLDELRDKLIEYAPAPLVDQMYAAARERDQMFRLYAKAHLSSPEGLRAATELAALAEDWFDANDPEGWPLPRVARATLAGEGAPR